MATQPNPSITATWSQAVDASLDFTISLIHPVAIEWAANDAALPPSADIKGHRLDPLNNEGITRVDTGPGYIWLRLASGGSAPVPVALTTWAPAP